MVEDSFAASLQTHASPFCALLLLVAAASIASRLASIHALLIPDASCSLSELPSRLSRKASVLIHGAVFLALSADKVSQKQLKRAQRERVAGAGAVEREVRLIFIRHGESVRTANNEPCTQIWQSHMSRVRPVVWQVWNSVFNRRMGPSFLVRLARVMLRELFLLPWDDSAFVDSPLSPLGLEQCAALQAFLAKPCMDPRAESDFAALTAGESSSLLVSSQLRRAAATIAITLSDRLRRSREKVLLHSSCQEVRACGGRTRPHLAYARVPIVLRMRAIRPASDDSLSACAPLIACATPPLAPTAAPSKISRNVDTFALVPKQQTPHLWLPDPANAPSFDGAANGGNKTLTTPGVKRLHDFARFAADRPEGSIIVGGHSLWFRSFFQLFLPPEAEHQSKKRKIVNCGVVGLTLQVIRDYHGDAHYRIDPHSIAVVYGGFTSA